MNNGEYYKQHEAEQIKSAFESWLGREAHIGRGQKQTLISIRIKPKRQVTRGTEQDRLFKVTFEFDNNTTFSASEFLSFNSIEDFRKRDLNDSNNKDNTAA